MIEFRNNPNSSVWLLAEGIVIEQLRQYHSQTGIEVDDHLPIVGKQDEIILKAPIPLLPFLKRVVIRISHLMITQMSTL